MATRPTPRRTIAAARTVGSQLQTWRKLLDLPAQIVAERAGISRSTLSRLENGDVHVGMDSFLNVASALGVLDAVVSATDPYTTDFGRARRSAAPPTRTTMTERIHVAVE